MFVVQAYFTARVVFAGLEAAAGWLGDNLRAGAERRIAEEAARQQ